MERLLEEQARIEASGLLDGSALLMKPTGSGKTWLARRAIHKTLSKGLKAVYLSPLRAIARELHGPWVKEFAEFRVGLYTGEVGLDEAGDTVLPRDADVLIATPEKMDLYARSWSSHLEWLARIGLIVVDELHTLDAGRRGATLEGLITRLRCINPYLEVLSLSATLGNPEELAAWLKAQSFRSDLRPVPLAWRIRAHGKTTTKAELVVEEAQATVGAGGQCIVFVQSRPRTESVATKLQEAGIAAAAHHAGMSKAARDAAEEGYRDGRIGVLVATPTLAMGVNLPARKVILHDLQRWDKGGWADLKTNEVWQLAGRAGRMGLDEKGEVVLIAPVWNQKRAREYIQGKFEPIESQLKEDGHFCEQLMVCFGSRMAVKVEQAERIMAGTLVGQGTAPGHMTKRVRTAVADMVKAGMLDENEEGYIRATRLGRVATRFQLRAKTVMAWRKLEDLLQGASMMDILLSVCSSADFTARVRVEHDDVERIQAALDSEAMELRSLSAETRNCILGVAGKDLVAATKTAVSLMAWTRLGDMQEAALAMGLEEHELEEARKEAVRLIQGMRAMLETGPVAVADLDADRVSLGEKAAALGAMVCAGLDDSSATLSLIEGIGPVMARRLSNAGIRDVEDLALLSSKDLLQLDGVGKKRAASWVEEAALLVKQGGALRYREICQHGGVTPKRAGLAKGLDFYRWARSAALAVREEGEGWLVTGGSEPHRVGRSEGGGYSCDCADAAKGRLCKHRIRVMHDLGEPGIPRYAEGFPAQSEEFDLEAEWARGALMAKAAGWR